MCIIPGPLIQQSIKNYYYCLIFYSFQKDHKKKAAEWKKEDEHKSLIEIYVLLNFMTAINDQTLSDLFLNDCVSLCKRRRIKSFYYFFF